MLPRCLSHLLLPLLETVLHGEDHKMAGHSQVLTKGSPSSGKLLQKKSYERGKGHGGQRSRRPKVSLWCGNVTAVHDNKELKSTWACCMLWRCSQHEGKVQGGLYPRSIHIPCLWKLQLSLRHQSFVFLLKSCCSFGLRWLKVPDII